MWKSFVLKKVFVKSKSVSDLYKTGNTIWKQNIVLERKRRGIIKQNKRELLQILGVTVPTENMVRAAAVMR